MFISLVCLPLMLFQGVSVDTSAWHLISTQLCLQNWLIIQGITYLLNLHGCATIKGSPPISSIKLRSSHPCKCVRWPCSLSRLSDVRCDAFEGRAQLRLCPVHVLEALLLMSESLCLCSSSPTLSHLPFSSSSLETALFRLSLTGSPQNLLFSSLVNSSTPYFFVSATHLHLTGQWQQQQDNSLTGLLASVCSTLETKHDWTKAKLRWIKTSPH